MEGLAEATTERPVVEGRGLSKTYGSVWPFGRDVEVLDGVDLSIYGGEVLGVVGQNGAGKSTLMQILVGALRPDEGEVAVDGRLGWCPQRSRLYDRLTVEETFELFGQAYGLEDAETLEAGAQLANRLGFLDDLGTRVDRLSGGTRQKLNLSVALLHDPDVLLLDEPYTGFDWQTYQAFWELSEDLVDRGKAVAIVSHLVNETERFDRILELRGGHLQPTEGP